MGWPEGKETEIFNYCLLTYKNKFKIDSDYVPQKISEPKCTISP